MDGAAMAMAMAEGLSKECREKMGGGVSGNDLSNTSSTIDESASISLCRTSAAASPATKSHHPAGHASEKPVVLKRLVPEMEAKSPSSQVSVAGFTGKSKLLNGEMVEDKKTASECSMCGDVGFVRDLRLCKRCGYRLQHTYCSKLYPDLDMESWACEWCLFEEESNGAVKAKLGKRKMESRTKAFEFLLQIAQESPTSSSSSERQRYRPDGIATRKENGFKCGVVKVGRAEQRLVQTPRFIKEDNTLKLGHLYQDWKEDSAMKNGGQVPKKQRCNNSHPPSDKNNKALDKWRNLAKSKLHCSNTSKAIVRRYKLLADVLC